MKWKNTFCRCIICFASQWS